MQDVMAEWGEKEGGAEEAEAAVDLLERLLAWSPARRITAAEALQHRYFTLRPYAAHEGNMAELLALAADALSAAATPTGDLIRQPWTLSTMFANA